MKQCNASSTSIKLSLIIPCLDPNDPKLKELLRSIDAQDFPKSEMEVLVISEGTSESAKAIGIRRAKGDVIGILASDNEISERDTHFLSEAYMYASKCGAAYPAFYFYKKDDDLLNRYFSLIGGNDPLSYYMGKNDRFSYIEIDNLKDAYNKFNLGIPNKTTGDNGYFVRKEAIVQTDLDNYYHIDNSVEVSERNLVNTFVFMGKIWHKTGGNIFSFFKKRYKYGLQHAFNKNRRWHLVDFSKPQDIWRLIWFVVCTVTVIQPLVLSIRGWLKIRDVAWFLHWPVCLLTLGTYTILILHHGLRCLTQSLFAPTVAQKA